MFWCFKASKGTTHYINCTWSGMSVISLNIVCINYFAVAHNFACPADQETWGPHICRLRVCEWLHGRWVCIFLERFINKTTELFCHFLCLMHLINYRLGCVRCCEWLLIQIFWSAPKYNVFTSDKINHTKRENKLKFQHIKVCSYETTLRNGFAFVTISCTAFPGVCKMYEEHLKRMNPNSPSITYDISQLFDFIDDLADLSCLV